MNKNTNNKSVKKPKKFIPEADVIQKLYNELIDDYGYKPEQIKLEFSLQLSKMKDFEKTRIDMAIFNENTNQLETIIEVKSSLKIIDDDSLEYFSEILAESDAKYGMFYNGFNKICFKKILDYHVIEVDDIPRIKKTTRKKHTNVKVKFWNILEHLRRQVPSSEYLEILTSLLYLKLNDEQKSNNFFENLTNEPVTNKEKMTYLFESNIFPLFFLDSLNKLEPKLLTILLFEMQNFSIKDSDPEEIAEQIFSIWENDAISKKISVSFISKPILNFMYLYLAYYQDPDDMKKLDLLSVFGSNRTCYDLIDFSSDHMNLTGNSLKDYCKKHLTVIDNDRSKISFLDVLLHIKKIKPTLIANDPLYSEFDKKFDFIIAIPPLGKTIHQKNTEVHLGRFYENYLIEKLLSQLKSDGLMSIIVSPLFLNGKNSLELRQFLIKNITVHGIIQLPSGVFPESSIRPVVLFLQNSKPLENSDIFISDIDLKLRRHETINQKLLNDIFDKFIELQTIGKLTESNDMSFNVNLSQFTDGDWSIQNKVPMMQKLSESTAQFTKDGFVFGGGTLIVGKDIAESDSEESFEISQIRISDIENSGLIKTKLEKKIHVSSNVPESKLTLVKENDVLLSIKGTIGKVAIVTKNQEGTHVGSQFVIIRPSMSKDTEYYLNYLNSDIVQYQLKKLTSGSIIPYLRIKDLEKIYFPPPDGMKVQKIKKLRSEIEEYKQRLAKSEEELTELLKK